MKELKAFKVDNKLFETEVEAKRYILEKTFLRKLEALEVYGSLEGTTAFEVLNCLKESGHHIEEYTK